MSKTPSQKKQAALEAPIYDQNGKAAGAVALPGAVFGLSWNADLVHQVVQSILSSRRTPNAHTKTRGEVSGTGKKPWQQKGTGRARHGSRRSPLWVKGGVSHGPRKDKDYTRKVNQKMKTKALFTILSRKMRDGEILFVDSLGLKEPKTKLAKAMLGGIGSVKGYEALATRRKNAAYIALGSYDQGLYRAMRNFSNIHIDDVRNINPVDILQYKYLVITSPAESVGRLEKKTA